MKSSVPTPPRRPTARSLPSITALRGWRSSNGSPDNEPSRESGARWAPYTFASAPELARTTGRFLDQTREMAIHLPADVANAVVQGTLETLGGG
ncbi:MAG TPA: hypothetical protein VN894_01540 [Polyangiaceae bacterium]|nr:hypothetical protein [Polyangiaceae bacterium]